MSRKPILDALQILLGFKDTTTYTEVARVSGEPKRTVLQILNCNTKLIIKDRKTGKITGLKNHTNISVAWFE